MRYAIIDKKSGMVVNVTEWEGDAETWQPPEGHDAVASESAGIGDTYGADGFTSALDAVKPTADSVRAERDRRLNMSDWTQLRDVPESTSTAWAKYRQALRDVAAQATFPDAVKWPKAPA